MLGPLKKSATGVKRNRSSYEYQQRKRQWLKAHREFNGYYICELCHKWTDSPELDHIDPTRMGGSPSRLMNEDNWQLLCRDCHQSKTTPPKGLTKGGVVT